MTTVTVILVTLALLLASAFFVMIEFALLGAKRHRLEEQASIRLTARAALRGMDELTVMLASAQLGITAVTFALGAVTKPAVSSWIKPLVEAVGLPSSVAYPVSFILALLVVTFLHLVIGEMAPKSWAIAFPERAVRLIAVPARGLAWLLRPLLIAMNRAANRLVRWSGVEPVDRAAAGGHDADSLRHLVEHSAQTGALDAADRDRVIGALDLTRRTLGELPGRLFRSCRLRRRSVRCRTPPVPRVRCASWWARALSSMSATLSRWTGRPWSVRRVLSARCWSLTRSCRCTRCSGGCGRKASRSSG